MLSAMFWPLIGGFVAFILLVVLLGWVMDTSRHDGAGDGGAGADGEAGHDGH